MMNPISYSYPKAKLKRYSSNSYCAYQGLARSYQAVRFGIGRPQRLQALGCDVRAAGAWVLTECPHADAKVAIGICIPT